VLHEYVVCDGVSVAVYDIDHDEFVVSASEGMTSVRPGRSSTSS
jgi:hypothetical protein